MIFGYDQKVDPEMPRHVFKFSIGEKWSISIVFLFRK